MAKQSVKYQARKALSLELVDLAVVNKVKGCLVVIKSDMARMSMSDADWSAKILEVIKSAPGNWQVIRHVEGLIIFSMKE